MESRGHGLHFRVERVFGLRGLDFHNDSKICGNPQQVGPYAYHTRATIVFYFWVVGVTKIPPNPKP